VNVITEEDKLKILIKNIIPEINLYYMNSSIYLVCLIRKMHQSAQN